MKIFAIGMNYALHNKEMRGTLLKTEKPVVFLKADSSLLKNGKPFFVPDHLGRIEYEAHCTRWRKAENASRASQA